MAGGKKGANFSRIFIYIFFYFRVVKWLERDYRVTGILICF